jgi:SAM-dependent methyltransferase
VADLPLALPGGLADRLARALDQEGKIPRVLDTLGPLEGRTVVLVDGAGGRFARALAARALRLRVLEREERLADLRTSLADLLAAPSRADVDIAGGEAGATGLPNESVDTLVGLWSAYRAPARDEVAEADRILRPGGRLLVVHDYGRDDVSRLVGERPEYDAWSKRDGWYLRHGFRMRVVHCFWTFATVDEAQDLVVEAFPETGPAVADELRRPRLTYNVAVYHRTRGDAAVADGGPET